MVTLLICDCGDCRHWEISRDFIICKSCSKEFKTTGLGKELDEHVNEHAQLSWKDHEV